MYVNAATWQLGWLVGWLVGHHHSLDGTKVKWEIKIAIKTQKPKEQNRNTKLK